MAFKDDKAVLKQLSEIKLENKKRLAEYVKKQNGIEIDPNSVFDMQVKRMHEYKRQHLNALEILSTYLWLRQNPNADFTPHTYIFGAKSAPGYYFAKQMIRFIVKLGDLINNDPLVNKKMKVVYVENYSVSLAELMIPSADISEQISLAGTEASGTSNMKFMINGAVTLGTLDGANVEIHESVGDDNIILFGMTTPQVNQLKQQCYHPELIAQNSPVVREALEFLQKGFGGVDFRDIVNSLRNVDPYMVLADFDSYSKARKNAVELYKNQEQWQKMCLVNIANAGRFSADRAIREYAENIWHASPLAEHPTEKKPASKRRR